MDEITVDAYNQLPLEYDKETTAFWEEFPGTIIDRFCASLMDKRVLDIGSGPGRGGELLKKEGCEIVCLDASEKMVKLCRSRGLESVIGDFIKMPFPDKDFGGAWAYTSLLHLPKSDINKPLEEINRILKHNGILGLGMIEGTFEGYRKSSGMTMARYFAEYTKSELEFLLESHGFEIIYFENFKPGSRNYLNIIAKKNNVHNFRE